ncbi:UDP-glucose dehydrogenase [Hoeflea marina]|uniref:UDP-glucose 6-dehydrogenase n=1 Tax=Hoeflea marina TaxID=274592 RepID=A0A317PTW5_9HYPH|nr:UDP-glucose/GDP-mannose dehydrogenase family protein [Hoeflea marina]PWW02274.1 UDP-glucose dehydrogenase [Hoeflea marina]
MNIAMIGTGYVGLVSGVCFAEFGFQVTCVDKDPEIVERLSREETTIFEPGLELLLSRNVRESRLTFTTDIAEAVGSADVVFIAVGTPSRRGGGEADLSYIMAAADEIAAVMQPGQVIAIKSTVEVGTNEVVRDRIRAARPGVPFSMVSNPEFLREGSAIEDFMRPDRVVIGAEDDHGREIMRRVYRPLFLRDTPMVSTTLANAELIKYASNAFLAVKVSFINQIADLCEKVGGDVQDVARAMGMDGRIGAKFLHPGPGFGGSCFPKDTRALASIGRKRGARQLLVEAAENLNEARKLDMAERILTQLRAEGGDTVAILGVAFKPNTDDIREAPSLTIIGKLIEAGVKVKAHDPEAMEAARKLLPGVDWCRSAWDAVSGAHVTVLVTEWNAYRALDLRRVSALMAGTTMIDMRNVYSPAEIAGTGLSYHSIGRASIQG